MTRERRQFSREFKLEAVGMLRAGRSLAQVARELEVRPEQLRLWRKKFAGEGVVEPPPRVESAEAEVRRLQRELAVVRQERDFLKKAAAFFAKGSAGSAP